MINQFIYKQLNKIQNKIILFILWLVTSVLLSSILYNLFAWFIRFILGLFMQAKEIGRTLQFTNILPKELPELSFITSVILASVFLTLMLFVVYRYYKKLEFAYGSLQTGDKATGRFTTDKEIKEQYKEINKYQKIEPISTAGFDIESRKALEKERLEKNKPYKGLSGTLIARIGDKLYIDTDDAHSLIIGRTRSGKTQSKVLSDIEITSRSEEKPHMIISSGKYELLQGTQKMLKERG